ncbi:50S ribosomal protein L11 methyltransferase [Streptomyces sp. TRM66268-LWL]|uniref:50S ribosomal protein L11 methyltransferase n=1 Tax=Streptomyces polyasparticus TaxID=2767826 RepID=A0ABR7SX37_9ACTN|nr:50S ribosomal protein L11 methyltransferase [Streptomyces polyasparticus]
MDAGCGAGLVTVAALEAGAHHVISQDYDGAALSDTARNVTDLLGSEARNRLTLWEADWSQLAPMHADVLAVNPPQRPAALLPDVPEDERHLHDGGGVDGLAALRMVLAHASTARVRSTAAEVLNVAAMDPSPWAMRKIASAELPFDPAWRSVLPQGQGTVDVWEFSQPASPARP